MRNGLCVFIIIWVVFFAAGGVSAEVTISEATSECLDCHASIHPGIVSEWQKSRHAAIHPKTAMAVEGPARKVSSTNVPESLQNTVVGCAECHMLRPDAHADTFEHNGYDIHVVVSPDDCRTCHSTEASQYSKNIMAHAYNNLAGNAIHQQTQRSIIGESVYTGRAILRRPANEATKAETCYYCHGTKLEVTGKVTRDTDAAGELEFPVIKGWPNQGVGRINLDGSLGACSACHTRHAFSIEMARKPYTCKECHIGPDVPAFKVYSASKHGNIFSTMEKNWEFKAVPWTIGKDFTAPTCAACHVSLLVNTDEEVVSERTHQMNNRLPWRLLGLIYAHPHPIEPDTSIIRNKDGEPLPTDSEGGFASQYLIDVKEQDRRRRAMQAACLNCHSTSWVEGHWARFENTIKVTNAETLVGANIVKSLQQLNREVADPDFQPFNPAINKRWFKTWLFYANTIRFASSMGGGGDYTVFADGRYQMSQNLDELNEWLRLNRKLFPKEKYIK